MQLEGERVNLRPLERGDADALLRVNAENREFFAGRESIREDAYYTLDAQRAQIDAFEKMAAERTGALLGVFLNDGNELIGFVALFGVIRGGFQEARIGYMLAERHGGRGYATEAVALALPFAFGQLDLHRLETGVQLDNPASMRVLEKNGFREEGVSMRWINVADGWADCKRFALTREEWQEARAREA